MTEETKITDDTKQKILHLVELNNVIRDRSSEIKVLRDEYKVLSAAVRDLMVQKDLRTVDARGSNVTVFEKRVAQKVDEDFVKNTLAEFLKEKKAAVGNPKSFARAAAKYLFDHKKTADNGSIWTLTVRKEKKAKGAGGGGKRGKKGKKEESDDDDDDADDEYEGSVGAGSGSGTTSALVAPATVLRAEL
jgi:hypothetical protein